MSIDSRHVSKSYIGEIVDIKDPRYEGRAKIRVFGFLDDISVENLPWAEQVSGLSFSSSKGAGNLTIPRLGSIVNVAFDESNYYKIYYTTEQEISPELLEELKQENSYEGSHALIYDTEAEPGALKIFYTKKKGLVLSLDNSEIRLDTQNNGELRIVIKMGEDEIRMENQKVIIKSENIELGDGAIEKIIKGSTFLKYFNTHTHPTGVGPSGAPIIGMQDQLHLSQISKTK